MRNHWFLCCFLLCNVLYFTSVYGQQQYHVSLIDTDDGLSQGTIYALFKDSRGFIWMGTGQSLSRYDGNQVRNYSTKGIPSPNSSSTGLVRAIVEDLAGNLWLSSGEVLTKFDRKKETFTPLKEKTAQGSQQMLGQPLALIGTKVWCISPVSKQLFYYDYLTNRKTILLTNLPLFLDTYYLQYHSTFDGRRYLWIHLTEGLLRFDIQTHQKVYLFSSHTQNKVGKPLVFTHFNLIKDGIRLSTQTATLVLNKDLKSYRYVKNIPTFEAKINSIVGGNQNFRWVYDSGDGILWVRGGIFTYKLNPLLPKFSKVTSNTHSDFEHTVVRGIMGINDSLVRVEEQSKRVYLYNRRSKKLVEIAKNDVLNQIVGKVVKDHDGAYWINTPRGLCLYNTLQHKVSYHLHPDTTKADDRLANSIFRIDNIARNTLLLSTESGIYIFDKPHKTYRRIPFFGTQGRAVLYGADGLLYLTDPRGLHIGKLQDTTWTATTNVKIGYGFRNGFEDTLHHRIFGATKYGLKIINKKDWSMRKWTIKEGLNDEYIYDVLVDKKGFVWVSTNQGLSRINLADATVFNFQLSDGLQGHEFNSRTAWIAPDGEFFFGGTRGFNHFYPDQIQINTHLPTVTLTDFKVKEKPYPLATYIGEAHSLVLSDQESTFSIDYSAIDYFSNGHNTYQYRLLGLDSNWIQVGSQTTARFMQVPAGTYQFEVKAANNDGLWNEIPTTLSIEIEPRLWETIWFRVVMLLLLVAGSYGIYRYRLYRIQLRQRHEMAIMVETQETERQRFAQDLHDGLGANLSAMKMILGLIKDPSSRPIKEKTESLLNESIDDLRQLIHAMSPRSLARLGLVKAVEEMAIIINQAHKVEVRVSAENFPNQLPDEIQTNLFRIVQELLQNAAKHAEATHITLALHQTTQHLVLHYTDNGRGFDASTSTTAGHGLLNLQTRAQLLNATLNIQSVPGKGTSVYLEMPYL